MNCSPFSLLTFSTSPEFFALSCDQTCLSTWKFLATFTPWHSLAMWSNMPVTEVIWMSDLTGTVLVCPDTHPPHRRVHLCFSHVEHGYSIKSKHFREELYSTTSLETREIQEQGLSNLAYTFQVFFYLLFITLLFPKSKCWSSASSKPHENLILQFECLVRFYAAGYEQCNCFSTGTVYFYRFEFCPTQSNFDAHMAPRDSCNIIT